MALVEQERELWTSLATKIVKTRMDFTKGISTKRRLTSRTEAVRIAPCFSPFSDADRPELARGCWLCPSSSRSDAPSSKQQRKIRKDKKRKAKGGLLGVVPSPGPAARRLGGTRWHSGARWMRPGGPWLPPPRFGGWAPCWPGWKKQSCARIISPACYYLHFQDYLHTRTTMNTSLSQGREGFQDRAHLSNASTASNSKGHYQKYGFWSKKISTATEIDTRTHRQIKHLSIKLYIYKKKEAANKGLWVRRAFRKQQRRNKDRDALWQENGFKTGAEGIRPPASDTAITDRLPSKGVSCSTKGHKPGNKFLNNHRTVRMVTLTSTTSGKLEIAKKPYCLPYLIALENKPV